MKSWDSTWLKREKNLSRTTENCHSRNRYLSSVFLSLTLSQNEVNRFWPITTDHTLNQSEFKAAHVNGSKRSSWRTKNVSLVDLHVIGIIENKDFITDLCRWVKFGFSFLVKKKKKRGDGRTYVKVAKEVRPLDSIANLWHKVTEMT